VRLAWGETGAWRPHGGRDVAVRDLAAGDMIEVDRALWQVDRVRDVPEDEWDDTDREQYRRHTAFRGPGLRRKAETGGDGQPAGPGEWSLRPVLVTVHPAGGGPAQRMRVRFRPYQFQRSTVYVIPAHHPVCAVCRELYPCHCLEIDDAADASMAALADLESVLPGCCWHCREPVTSRQKSIDFPGDNLLLPGAEPPVFHLRNGSPYCSAAAVSYERRWAAADPSRLPRLECPGDLVQHIDGYECTAGGRCPGALADHRRRLSHQSNAAYARSCERCAAACAKRGITIPAGGSPG